MNEAHKALRGEIWRRLDAVRDDPNVKNTNGSNYWGPYVTRAVAKREDDGPALVQYIKDVLRKPASDGWNALLEADRLTLSFEDMVACAEEPIRGLFTDEDRRIAEDALGDQRGELARRHEAAEADALVRDRRIVAIAGEKRRAQGKPWTAEMEDRMLANLAAERQRERTR